MRLAETAPDAPSTSPSHDIVVALVGAASSVVVALIMLANTVRGRRESPTTPTPTPPAPVPLNTDDDEVEDVELRSLRRRNRALERFLWRQRLDPNKIVTGAEAVTDVRFE